MGRWVLRRLLRLRALSVEALAAPTRMVLGTLAACLPARHWEAWEGRAAVRVMAFPAALLTFFAGWAIGIPGFFEYAQGMGTTVGDLVLESSHEVNKGRLPADAPVVAWYSMALALPAYIFLTPRGLFSTYLVASGLFRWICWAGGDPRGDPVLSVLDSRLAQGIHAARSRRVAAERNALEGPETPDVLVTGRAVGVADAVYAVIASRLKPAWEPGLLLLTEQGRFRVGERFDRRLPDGLRAVYPLFEVAAVEVTRRAMDYTLPPLSELDPVTRQVRPAGEP